MSRLWWCRLWCRLWADATPTGRHDQILKQRQLVRLTPEETQSLTELRQQALEATRERERLGFEPAVPALRYAEQHLFERRSVVQEHEVLAETLRQGRGR